jgi:flavin reductase
MIDPLNFREGMSRLVGAVTVITTDGPAGPGGFTASAVCSVTDDPPMLVVCMNRNSRQHQIFSRNGVLCVNVLTAHQEKVSRTFSGAATVEERFGVDQWASLETGAPALQNALVNFDTRIAQTIEAGTHSIFICSIVAIQVQPEAHPGLAYFGRKYHPVGLTHL